METGKNHINYEDRLNRVTEYIYDHLDDDIDLYRLAEIACLSPYHWHRIYAAIRGETIANTVKRVRLHRAAGYIAQTSMRVEDVAKRSGYPNLQSFNRIFKSVYGMPPVQYRKRGSHTQFHPLSSIEGATKMYDMKIENLPSMQVSTVDHKGSYMQISKGFEQLMGWLGARALINNDTRMFGIFYDDVELVPQQILRSKAAATILKEFPVEDPVQHTEPSRVYRRVQNLRELEHEQSKSIFP